MQAQTDKSLYDLGVISGLTYSASKGKADELTTRNDLEKQRLTLNEKAIETQIAVQQTKVDQAKALLALKQKQLDALSVRAGISGVLVELDASGWRARGSRNDAGEGGAAGPVEGQPEDRGDAGAGHPDWPAGGDRHA